MPLKTKPANVPTTHVSPRAVAVSSSRGQLVPGLGNVTTKDIIIPRLKIMQGLSPELQENPDLRVGQLYHSLLGEALGNEIPVVVLQIQRSIELWAPRGDDRGVLARSLDGINWDKPNEKFEVVVKKRRRVYETKGSVGESGLAEFGTSDPSDPRSAPAASLTYRIALANPENLDLGPMLMINAKTGVKPSMDLISRINLRHLAGTPFPHQKYILAAVFKTKGENKWYEPAFRNGGNVTDQKAQDYLMGLSEGMATMNIRAQDETQDAEREDRSNEARY